MQRLILIFGFFMLAADIYAQSSVPSLPERAATSDVIFEGKVIGKESFWNESNAQIFTKNYVQVSHYLKGTGDDIFELITQGGDVGDVFQEISHGIFFETGQEGMFLCRNFQVEPLGGQNLLMLNGSGGFLGFQRTPTETIVSDHNATYHSLKTEVYPQIGLSEQQVAILAAQSQLFFSGPDNGQEIEFDFANLNIIGISSLEFDVFAKSPISPVKFAGGSIFIKYSTDVFGQSVVANSNIAVTKGDIVQNAGYTLGTADFSTETVKISTDIDCRSPELMHTLGTTFEKLCHVVVDIANIGVIGSLGMDDFAMNGNVFYYDPERGCVPFETVTTPKDIEKLLIPVIQTYDSVATAGTGFLLRIKGLEFGTDKGDVVFKNANTGGASVMFTYKEDIFKWTNDSIIVRVPSNGQSFLPSASQQPAGSGMFEVRLPSSSGGATAVSPGPLEIRYAVHNFRPNTTNHRTYFGETDETDGNVNGVLTFRLDSLIQFNDSARACVVTAMCDWSGKSGVQWDLGPVSPKKIFADNDSNNLILLAPASLFFGETANATAYTQLTGARIEPCAVPVRFMREVDIVIRRDVTGPPVNAPGGYNFNSSALPGATQMDFYSVVAHELGHSHLLRHALPTSKIMYPFLMPGQYRKIISVADRDGGISILDSSIVKLAPFPTCATAIQKGVGCLATSTKEGIEATENIILYPNPFEDKITIISEGKAEKQLTLFNQLGQALIFKKIEKGAEVSELHLGGIMPAGQYFLTVQAGDKISSFKLVKN